jgi:hypothetical protein
LKSPESKRKKLTNEYPLVKKINHKKKRSIYAELGEDDESIAKRTI